ncbi:O-antigen polymerase [Aeromonas veronii]
MQELYEIITILFLSFLLISSSLVIGKYSPSSIFLSVWLMIIAAFFLFRDSFIPVGDYTIICIVVSQFSIWLSSVIVHFIFEGNITKKNEGIIRIKGNELVAKFLLLFVVVSGVPYFKILGLTFSLDYFSSVRILLNSNDGELFGLVGRYAQMIMVVCFFICATEINNKIKVSFFIVALLFNIPLLSKENIVLFFLSYTYFMLLTGRLGFTSSVFKFILPLFALMFGIMYLRYGELFDIDFFNMMIKTYFLSSIPAFDILIQSSGVSLEPTVTLRSFYIFLNKFDLGYEIPPMLQSFVRTPYMTNIYTFLRPYYVDFGLLGIVVFSFSLGAILTCVYESAIRGNNQLLLLLSVFSFPIVFSFFDEKFFTWTTQWFFIYILAHVITKRIKMVN